jgi:hypothetical protein
MVRRKLSLSLTEVEQEIEVLRAQLSEAEAVRNYLLRHVSSEQEGRSSTALGKPADSDRLAVNWPSTVDQFLSEHTNERFSIHELVARLKERHPDLRQASDPASLLRATLNRYGQGLGWKKERQGRSMLWFKEPVSGG